MNDIWNKLRLGKTPIIVKAKEIKWNNLSQRVNNKYGLMVAEVQFNKRRESVVNEWIYYIWPLVHIPGGTYEPYW